MSEPNDNSAFRRFKKTVVRTTISIKLYNDLLEQYAVQYKDWTFPEGHPSDLLRAAVVLAVAAMDAYYTNKFVEMLVPYLRNHKPGQKMIDILYKAGLNTEEAINLLTTEHPFDRIQNLVGAYLDGYVTQRFEKIDELFLAYGIKDFTLNAEKSLKQSTYRETIASLIERRHEIAHNGDYDECGMLRTIDSEMVKQQIATLSEFVTQSEKMINAVIRPGDY
jgi:hypothetical protein